MSGAPTGKDSQRELFLEHMGLKKDHEDLQQRYDKLLEENLKFVQSALDQAELLKLAIPTFEGLLHLVPDNQLSDTQKSAKGAIATLKMLI